MKRITCGRHRPGRPQQRDRPRLGRRCDQQPCHTSRQGRHVPGHRQRQQDRAAAQQKVKIKGTVSPAAPGAGGHAAGAVRGPQELEDHRPRRLCCASKVKFKDKVGSVRERKYRVVKPAGPNRAAGSQPERQGDGVRVAQPHVDQCRDRPDLVASGTTPIERRPATPTRCARATRARTNGSHRLQPQPGLQGVPTPSGLDDASPSGGSTMVVAGRRRRRRSTPAHSRSPSRSRWSSTSPASSGSSVRSASSIGGIAAVGTPQVLCSF